MLSERALERRLKRHLLKQPQAFFAACAPGFEDVLAREVAALPAVSGVNTDQGGVGFEGPLETLYHANLWLRTAHRVLLRVDEGLTQSQPALFNLVQRVPWELYLGFQAAYSVRVSAKASRLNHARNVIATVQAGIRAALAPLGLSPNLHVDAPTELHVRLFQDRCTVSVNTSGAHLHKRGYRTLTGPAPLRETLAAAVLLTADWAVHDLILDPMCGSGTLLVEAALLASGAPPGGQRTFAFEHAPYFQASKWERLRREAVERQQVPAVRLLGSDVDGEALELVRAAAAAAGVAPFVSVRAADATRLTPPEGACPLLVSNLPYGARLGTTRDVSKLLRTFGAHLRTQYGGWTYSFVTHHASWLNQAGLEPDRTRRFRNGGLTVTLAQGVIR